MQQKKQLIYWFRPEQTGFKFENDLMLKLLKPYVRYHNVLESITTTYKYSPFK